MAKNYHGAQNMARCPILDTYLPALTKTIKITTEISTEQLFSFVSSHRFFPPLRRLQFRPPRITSAWVIHLSPAHYRATTPGSPASILPRCVFVERVGISYKCVFPRTLLPASLPFVVERPRPAAPSPPSFIYPLSSTPSPIPTHHPLSSPSLSLLRSHQTDVRIEQGKPSHLSLHAG